MAKAAILRLERTAVRLVFGTALAATAVLASTTPARATEAEQVTLEEDTSSKPAKPAAATETEEEPKEVKRIARYSLPWELRPVTPMNYVRLDNSFAFYGVGGTTIVNQLSGSYKIIPRISVLAKLTVANNSPPNGPGGFGFANPLIGAQAGFWPAKSWKLGLFLGFTVPVGPDNVFPVVQNQPDRIPRFMLARSGFDDPLFMADYFGTWPGVDLAYVTHGFTAQAEVSLPIMNRVRGATNIHATNAELQLGLHAGYFIFPWLSAGLDLRHQRWLTTPDFVSVDTSGTVRDDTTIEVGVRFHVKVTDDITWRPGLSMAFGLDDPMAGASYKVVHIDLPFQF